MTKLHQEAMMAFSARKLMWGEDRSIGWEGGFFGLSPSPRREEGPGDGGIGSRVVVLLICTTVIVFGLLSNRSPAEAQPMVLEKIRAARDRLDGLELHRQMTVIREAIPVTRGAKARGRKPAVRYVRHQALMRDVVVVGLSLTTGELKDFTFSETVRINRKGYPLPKPPQVIAREDGCELVWRGGSRWGFNRDLLLTCNDEQFVVINLTMWTSRTERKVMVDGISGKRMCRQSPAELLIGSYVPYSSELHTQEMVEEGRRYLEQAILQALGELDELNVTARAFTEQTLSELASIEFIHALLIDEHMDPDDFRKNERNGTLSRLIEKYWVEVALNQDSAFKLSVSPAGAAGISQFICPTYARILDEAPNVRLDPVFIRGMQDHVNAIKASITLFDSDMSSWWTATTRNICSASADMLEDCWAASYNGGPNRLNRIIAKRGKEWDKKGSTTTRHARRYFTPQLKDETYTYLEKLRSIREHLTTLEKRTPPSANSIGGMDEDLHVTSQ